MQEHTILFLSPFGIDCNTTFRHSGESIGLLTQFINIPTLKHKAGRNCYRRIAVIGCDICFIGYVIYCSQQTSVSLTCKTVAITIVIGTIHESDGVNFAKVKEVYGSTVRGIEFVICITILNAMIFVGT